MPRLSKEDWVCSDPKCKNVNFSKRDKCNRCGIPRKYSHSRKTTEIGKQVAGKSKGLFSPEDWVCKTCGNINWARRNTCNVCNGPKFDIQGERTGYGGGFMERDEVVEYRDHGDSDDEFDEFGRKKKRFRKNQDDQNSNEIKEKENGNEDGQTEKIVQYDEDTQESREEDEEESGEDADLSKYDIWGIENDGDSSTQPPYNADQPPEKAASRSSRSRSVSSSSSSSSDSNSRSSSSSSSSSGGSQSSHSSSSSSSGSRNGSTEKSTKESQSPHTSGKGDTSDKSLPATSKAERKKNGRQHERSRSPLLASS